MHEKRARWLHLGVDDDGFRSDETRGRGISSRGARRVFAVTRPTYGWAREGYTMMTEITHSEVRLPSEVGVNKHFPCATLHMQMRKAQTFVTGRLLAYRVSGIGCHTPYSSHTATLLYLPAPLPFIQAKRKNSGSCSSRFRRFKVTPFWSQYNSSST